MGFMDKACPRKRHNMNSHFVSLPGMQKRVEFQDGPLNHRLALSIIEY
jgi:hypothetical protein